MNDPLNSRSGTLPTVGISLPPTSAVLNVEEYASIQFPSNRTGFPKQDGQSLSHWLQQVRNDPLLDHRSTPELPDEADTVIIGSGASGTLIAKTHLEIWPERSVVIIEAREFCSGATGRNAGHCKPDQWRKFAVYQDVFGTEQALKILQNEQDTWQALVSYVRMNNVDCDLWVGDTIDVAINDEVADIMKTVFAKHKAAGGRQDHIKVTHDPEEAAKISKITSAKACYTWPASTLQPWKLMAHVMRENLKKGANLQTHTTGLKVTESTQGERRWLVHSDRGTIACTNVVYATNAYTAAIDPAFKGLITPTPHMCNRAIPPRSLSGSKSLQNSYGILLPDGTVCSINPRAVGDGMLLIGGHNPGQRELDEYIAKKHPERCIDDSITNVDAVTDWIREFVQREIVGWKDASIGPGEGLDYSWSGIIGRSKDAVPWIGELPGKSGQWICAGHCGHGMARIFTCAPGLVKLMHGKPWASTGIPEVYQITEERIYRAKEKSSDPVATIRPRF